VKLTAEELAELRKKHPRGLIVKELSDGSMWAFRKPTVDEWRDAVDNAETEALLAYYLAAERDSDPTVVELADIDPAVFALVEEAQKKSAPELLRAIDICTLRSLLVSSAGPRRPSTPSRSGSSSSGATPAPPPSPPR
jgi:hypothetical protein